MAADRTKALTTPHRIKPTSTSRQSAWRPNPGRRSTYRRGDSVQTTGTSSDLTLLGMFPTVLLIRFGGAFRTTLGVLLAFESTLSLLFGVDLRRI